MYREKGTRPITRASINSRSQIRSKKDKKDWDDRFSIERMPQYNALRDKHCQAYVNMIKRKFKKTKRIQGQIELAPGRIRKRKLRIINEGADDERAVSRRLGQRPPKAGVRKSRPVITDEIMNNLEEELAKLWEEQQIIQYHKDTFLKFLKLLPRESSAAMMAKEIEDLKKNKAPIQRVILGIYARENCLNEIQEFEYDENEKFEEFITKCIHKLHSLRMLSLNAVECIVIWREQMLYAHNQSLEDHKGPSPVIPFLWDNENYLTKIKSDTNFLIGHSLSKYFNFSDKADPFLVIPSCAHTAVGLKGLKKVRKKQAKKRIIRDGNKYEVPLDNSLMQRIRASEKIIENEVKDPFNEVAMSPQTNKTISSPTKSENNASKLDTKSDHNMENTDPNGDVQMASNKRESLFDLRKKKEESLPNLHNVESEPTPQKQTPDKIMQPEDDKPEPIKEEVDEDMDEDFEYTLFPLQIKESEIQSYLQNYISRLDENLGKSYVKPENLLNKLKSGNNAQIYGLSNKGSANDIDGLFIYNLDSHFNRLNIFHLSTTNKKGIESAIVPCITHAWNNENILEIRLFMHYFQGEKKGKPAKVVDDDLNQALKKNKMRWKSVVNENNEMVQLMGANRTDQREAINELNEVFKIKAGLLFNTLKENPGSEDVFENNNLSFAPGLYLNSLINKTIPESEDKEHHKLFQNTLAAIKNSNTDAFPLVVSKTSTNGKDASQEVVDEGIFIDSSVLSSEVLSFH